MKLLDLRNTLCKELIVLCQFTDVKRVNLAFLLDLIFKVLLLEVLVKCLGQSTLALSNYPIPEEEGFLK